MTISTEPETGLQYVELSHPWHHNQPVLPGLDELILYRSVNHAKHGVMSQKFKTTFHTSTHVNAPIHLVSGAKGVGELPLETFWGTGVVLSIPKGQWELITVEDLNAFADVVNADDIVLINTGWHQRYADSQDYFGHSPGLSLDAAQWFVDKKIKLLGVDTPQVDHPLATSLAEHRNGPTMKRLSPEYERATGRNAKSDFPNWMPAHRLLLQNDIPTIENVGGDLNVVTKRRCTFHAMPWRWNEGDACVVRLMALMDPQGQYQLESGQTTA